MNSIPKRPTSATIDQQFPSPSGSVCPCAGPDDTLDEAMAMAILAQRVYGDSALSFDDSEGITGEMWSLANEVNSQWALMPGSSVSKSTGFQAASYRNGNRIAVVYEGTDDLWDWALGNIPQAFGKTSPHYDRALLYAAKIKLQNPGAEITFVGHSMGGGMAMAAASVFGDDFVAFNAAGVNPNYQIPEALRDMGIIPGAYADRKARGINMNVEGEVLRLDEFWPVTKQIRDVQTIENPLPKWAQFEEAFDAYDKRLDARVGRMRERIADIEAARREGRLEVAEAEANLRRVLTEGNQAVSKAEQIRRDHFIANHVSLAQQQKELRDAQSQKRFFKHVPTMQEVKESADVFATAQAAKLQYLSDSFSVDIERVKARASGLWASGAVVAEQAEGSLDVGVQHAQLAGSTVTNSFVTGVDTVGLAGVAAKDFASRSLKSHGMAEAVIPSLINRKNSLQQ